MKRRYEELARVEFDRLAKEVFPSASFTWLDVPQHLEPPDWFLLLNHKRYAVEATTIVDLLSITPETKLSAVNVIASIRGFVKDVEKAARERGILSGAYLISLSPIPNLSEHSEILRERFLEYIYRTQHESSAPEEILGYIREHRTTIKKEHNSKDYVTVGISLGVKWGADVREDLQEIVSSALASKANKLQRIAEPIILLLLDDYGYADLTDWASIIPLCPDRVRFCCICRIRPPDKPSIIWSSSPEWKMDTLR